MDTKKRTGLTTLGPEGDVQTFAGTGQSTHHSRAALSICIMVMIAVLSACSASTSTSTPPAAAPATIVPQAATPTQAPLPSPTTAPQALATSLPQSTAQTTALDPCQLIGSQEASAFTGASYGQGVEGSIPGGIKTCSYGESTSHIFIVDVAQASDLSTAKTYRDQFLQDLQANAQQLTSQGLNVTQLPSFADGAVIASADINGGGITLSASAIGVSKGTVFFGFSDTVLDGGSAPSSTALQAEATTVLGKLP